MAAKRSRLARSSSSVDTLVLSGSSILESEIRCPVSLQHFKASSLLKNNSPSIFSISVPDCDPVDRRWAELQKFGGFLEKCFYCGNKFEGSKEVFMYSNLRAFCSDECRTKQIDMDEDLKKLAETPMVKSGKRRS